MLLYMHSPTVRRLSPARPAVRMRRTTRPTRRRRARPRWRRRGACCATSRSAAAGTASWWRTKCADGPTVSNVANNDGTATRESACAACWGLPSTQRRPASAKQLCLDACLACSPQAATSKALVSVLSPLALQAEMSEDEGHSGSDSDAEDDAEGVLVRAYSHAHKTALQSLLKP